ncbi:hypothetical protein [Mycobacterium interjectum]|uniref:hypothetical protein n=1 Tax=Mycobacterium interjectum TaxID=33895 RepID=UPI000A883B39|nr:hypothetical protein [Mycobacterium interjectum]MCV7090206.1 hypothetical protein [Mycobacterium interjectum]
MTAKVNRCARCSRRLRNPRASGADWAVSIATDPQTDLSHVAEIYCPDCTTGTENVQRERTDAAVDYVWFSEEQFQMWPKAASN